jgi:hypothetical protein
MRIAISGITGFIGGSLKSYFEAKGDAIIPILRNDYNDGIDSVKAKIAGCNVVINLAGAPIVKRWTASYKKELEDSRLETTRMLVMAIEELETDLRPDVFISASAIGIYSSEGTNDEINFKYGDDFLATLCLKWEKEADKVSNCGVRLLIARFGLVLGIEGGMFPGVLNIFKHGLGGKIASGKQGFSFIHIDDVVRGVDFIIADEYATGVYNFVAPEPVNNEVFTDVLANMLDRPSFFNVPEFVLRLVFSGAASALVKGPVVFPKRLIDSGFKFSFPELHSALSDLI